MSREGRGFVSLVGAGPGDPGLLTVTGLARLQQADVVIYDRLASPLLLNEAPPEAERIDVGKRASGHTISQEEIGQLLVARARQGKSVVRLKGGDPFVFGRGAEEAEELVNARIEFEVVPGVTSAVAAPAYAGIPVTHRALASSFAVITGHEDASKAESAIDWTGLARGQQTLLFLMGRRTLSQITTQLVTEGRDPTTPAAAIRCGTTPHQQVVTATLGTIAEAADRVDLQPPVVVVIGDVVRLRQQLQWFEKRPLFGKLVLVTRARRQASDLARRLAAEGAAPLEFPSIEIVPADPEPARRAVATLAAGGYHWAIFTSVTGVRELFRHLDEAELDSRVFAGVRIAAIGPATAEALRSSGLRPDLLPDRFVNEALLEALAGEHFAGTRVLLARAGGGRDVLPAGLRARGARVDDVPLYSARRPAVPAPAALAALEAGQIDVVTFTASSTVRGCLEMLNGRTQLLADPLIACIGPVTARTASEAGLDVRLVSKAHTIPDLVAVLREHYRKVVAHA